MLYFAVLNPVKFAVAQKNHFPGRWNIEPWLIKQTHQMAHPDNPGAFEAIDFIEPCEKYIFTTLQVLYGLTQW